MKRIGFAGLVLVVLLFAAQVVSAQGQDCPWGYPAYDAATHTFVSQCSTPVKVAVAAKPAGKAQPAPAEKVISCDFDGRLDPLALACERPNWTVDAAAKPAGLAQPAPAPVVNCASYAGPGYSICVIASPK